MVIDINYFNEEFSMNDANVSRIQPFSHANVVVNCDQPLSCTNGELERKVEMYLNEFTKPLGIKSRWDKDEEWYEQQEGEREKPPRISKLGMGIDFDLDL